MKKFINFCVTVSLLLPYIALSYSYNVSNWEEKINSKDNTE